MLIITIVIIIYSGAVLLDFIPIVKSESKKEYLLYLALLAISFTMLILYGFNVKVPGPTNLIMNSIRKLFGV